MQHMVSPIMPVSELMETDKYLRTFCCGAAASNKAHLNNIELEMLQAWAGVHCTATAVIPVQRYAQILGIFTTNNKPLAPNRILSDMFM